MRISDWSSDVGSSDLTGAVLAVGRIGVGSMLAVARWAVDPDAFLGRPLGIVVLVKAAVDQMAPGTAAMALLQALEHRAHQAAEIRRASCRYRVCTYG